MSRCIIHAIIIIINDIIDIRQLCSYAANYIYIPACSPISFNILSRNGNNYNREQNDL